MSDSRVDWDIARAKLASALEMVADIASDEGMHKAVLRRLLAAYTLGYGSYADDLRKAATSAVETDHVDGSEIYMLAQAVRDNVIQPLPRPPVVTHVVSGFWPFPAP